MSRFADLSAIAEWLDDEEAAALLGYADAVDDVNAVPPVTFPTTRLRIRAELLLGGVWTAVPEYVLYEPKIVIQRGRRNERSTASPSTDNLTFVNIDKRFSPRNPAGPWYGQLRTGTKLRVWVNPGSGDSLRHTGEIPDLTPRWVITENSNQVQIQASGVTRRISQGSRRVSSPLFNTISTDSRMLRYWPCEDESNADSIASAHTGQTGATRAFIDDITLASNSTLPGTKPLPSYSSGGFINAHIGLASLPNNRWQIDLHYLLPSAPGTDTTVIEWYSTTGVVRRWNWVVTAAGSVFALHGYDATDTLVVNSSFAAGAGNPVVGAWVHLLVYAKQNGGNVDWEWKRFPSLGGDGSFANGSIAGTLGDLFRMATPPGQAGVSGMSTGHWTVYDGYGYIQAGSPATGYRGEVATDRFLRLCTEAGVSGVVNEVAVDGSPMGSQSTTDFLSLFRECEAANEGLLDEARDGSLRLGSRTARYTREIAMTLDYTLKQAADLVPVDDDFALRNDWTITRSGGSYARAEVTEGPLNVNDPEDDPEGAGRRDDSATLNLRFDDQTDDHAWYRVNRDTIDEQRFTTIRLQLHRTPELIPYWLNCDIGSRIQVLNAPEDTGPNVIDQIIEGYTETISHVEWIVELNTSPARFYNEIARYGLSRYDSSGTTLNEDLDTTEAGVDVLIVDGGVWAHDDGDYLITIGGEDMLVTAVSAASGTPPAQTQTLTVTRSVNGVTLSHSSGARVGLKQPGRYAL